VEPLLHNNLSSSNKREGCSGLRQPSHNPHREEAGYLGSLLRRSLRREQEVAYLGNLLKRSLRRVQEVAYLGSLLRQGLPREEVCLGKQPPTSNLSLLQGGFLELQPRTPAAVCLHNRWRIRLNNKVVAYCTFSPRCTLFFQKLTYPSFPPPSGLGQNTNPAQQHAGFGQSTNNVGLTMGQSAAANQQLQMVPGVRIDVSNIRPTTRFNDLQEDLQRHIAAIDEGIQKCIRDKEAVDVFLPAHGEQLSAIPIDVNFVTRKSDGAQAATESDLTALGQLRDFVRTDADHARLSFKAVDNLRLPAQYHQAGLWSTRSQPTAGGTGTSDDSQSSGDLISFFSKTADEMEEMMKKFEKNLGEIEVHMTGVQSNLFEQLQRAQTQSKNGTQGAVDERLLELNMVLQEFEQSILQVAGVVGGIKEGVTQLQLKDFMGNGS